MKDNKTIHIGDYVRTNDNLIAKVVGIRDIRGNGYDKDMWYETDVPLAAGYYEHFKAVSAHKADLIEVGDYVNGKEVMNVYIPNDLWEPIEIEVDSKFVKYFLVDEIESIVTKQQFERNEYKGG